MQGRINTHHCGELGKKDIGSQVILCGWVHKYRKSRRITLYRSSRQIWYYAVKLSKISREIFPY